MTRLLAPALLAVMLWTLVALSVTKCVGWTLEHSIQGTPAP